MHIVYTNAMDKLFADVQQCIVCGHNCPIANWWEKESGGLSHPSLSLVHGPSWAQPKSDNPPPPPAAPLLLILHFLGLLLFGGRTWTMAK